MSDAAGLFEESIAWLREHYADFTFFTERDVVWTLQTQLMHLIHERHLPYRVFNDFPTIPGPRRSLCADLAIIDENDKLLVAAELKYEPAHDRQDIWPSKFPVVDWGTEGVAKDIERIRRFVTENRVPAAYAVFIDEGGFFRKRIAHTDSEWIAWDIDVKSPRRVSVLWSEFHRGQ